MTCPQCNGDLTIERDKHEFAISCLTCFWMIGGSADFADEVLSAYGFVG